MTSALTSTRPQVTAPIGLVDRGYDVGIMRQKSRFGCATGWRVFAFNQTTNRVTSAFHNSPCCFHNTGIDIDAPPPIQILMRCGQKMETNAGGVATPWVIGL